MLCNGNNNNKHIKLYALSLFSHCRIQNKFKHTISIKINMKIKKQNENNYCKI